MFTQTSVYSKYLHQAWVCQCVYTNLDLFIVFTPAQFVHGAYTISPFIFWKMYQLELRSVRRHQRLVTHRIHSSFGLLAQVSANFASFNAFTLASMWLLTLHFSSALLRLYQLWFTSLRLQSLHQPTSVGSMRIDRLKSFVKISAALSSSAESLY